MAEGQEGRATGSGLGGGRTSWVTVPLPLGSGHRAVDCSQGGCWASPQRGKSRVRGQEGQHPAPAPRPAPNQMLPPSPGNLDGRAPGLSFPARGQIWSRNLKLPLSLVSAMLWKPLPWSSGCLSSSPTFSCDKGQGRC